MLIIGGENLKKIKKLISLTSIKSKKITNALIGYYCLGVRSPINKSNFRRAIRKIEKVNLIVEEIKELDNE